MVAAEAPLSAHSAQSQPICARCGGSAAPGGAWCDTCIAECRDYTEQLDLSRFVELNSESLGWAAFFYARAGIPVHPLSAGGREPVTEHGVKDASTDLQLVRTHWRDHPDHNIGLACGHLFDVVDIDVKGDKPGLESLEKLRRAGLMRGVWGKAITPSGGLHLLFAPSGAGCPTKLGSLGVDYKGRGGYVIGTPSVTPVGTYHWELVEPDRRGPTLDYDAAKRVLGITERQPAPASSESVQLQISGQNPRYVQKAIDDELEKLRNAQPRGRNIALNETAFALGQFVGAGEVSETEIEQTLIELARGLDTDPSDPFTESEIRSTVRSALEAGKREPRKVPSPLRKVPTLPPVTVIP
jgi:hypothetical protein